jgi:hypothetical protein
MWWRSLLLLDRLKCPPVRTMFFIRLSAYRCDIRVRLKMRPLKRINRYRMRREILVASQLSTSLAADWNSIGR